ncbi:MAG: Rieske (2Fe-2S) protein [Alphaproteobacteria bacterium]|nr:Rieske (2Fe-2S) protein [Alphaproteobacteria bacterium]
MHSEPEWKRAIAWSDLKEKGRAVVKLGPKQIALFAVGESVKACNNRCPHEGYPLVEGSLDPEAATGREDRPKACLLTCNWHNWRFDLDGGDSSEGDALRLYPTRRDGDDVLVDVADPPPEERIDAALDNLVEAMPRHEYDRLGREMSRLVKAGGALDDAVRRALAFSHDRFEYGGGHAFGAAIDWLDLADRLAEDEAERLAAYLEVIGHMSWDSMREDPFPFASEERPFDRIAFLDAVERQDEKAAAALLRGALSSGIDYERLLPVLHDAAFAHYQAFGHSVIYTYQYWRLAQRLGPGSEAPLLLSLLRHFLNARREDLIPEFRAYRPTLDAWTAALAEGAPLGEAPVAEPETYASLPMAKVMAAILESAAHPEALYEALLTAAALQFLRYDLSMDQRTDNSVAGNVTWLDFTHAITFANAARWAARREPRLWPQALLQIGCFLGRNARFLDETVALEDWRVEKPEAWLNKLQRSLLDHQFPEYIISCHYVKLSAAIQVETALAPDAAFGPILAAALNRMATHPPKRKHLLRTARQSMEFVAREG